MAFPVRYSIRAYQEYDQLLEYVSSKFSIEKVVEVDAYFEEMIDLIAVNPALFPYADKSKKLRRCVVSTQTTIYYRFTGKYVEIVSFRGNLMNPDTLNI